MEKRYDRLFDNVRLVLILFIFPLISNVPSTDFRKRNGPSEFFVTGSLKEWSIVEQLDRIIVPTLLINGRYDEAQDNVVRPFSQRLGTVTWVQFAQSSHMPQWEERAKFGQILGDFISS